METDLISSNDRSHNKVGLAAALQNALPAENVATTDYPKIESVPYKRLPLPGNGPSRRQLARRFAKEHAYNPCPPCGSGKKLKFCCAQALN